MPSSNLRRGTARVPSPPVVEDPYSRYGIWDNPALLERFIIENTVAEAMGGRDHFEKVAAEQAKTSCAYYRINITGDELVEGWQIMKLSNPSWRNKSRNPYRNWVRACDAVTKGCNKLPTDLHFRPGAHEKSVKDFKQALLSIRLKSYEQTLGRDIAERLRECLRISVDEMVVGRHEEYEHRAHSGACKLELEGHRPSRDTGRGTHYDRNHRSNSHLHQSFVRPSSVRANSSTSLRSDETLVGSVDESDITAWTEISSMDTVLDNPFSWYGRRHVWRGEQRAC